MGATPHLKGGRRQGVDPMKKAAATNGNAVSKEAAEQSKLAGDTIHIVPHALEPKRILLKKLAPPLPTPWFVGKCAVCARNCVASERY